MITAYAMIESKGAPEFTNEVNDMIAQGWQPHGQVFCVAHSNGKPTFYQAMVRFAP